MTGRGRPSTGVKVQVRIPADELEWIDADAKQHGTTRAEVIRWAVEVWNQKNPRYMAERTADA